MLWIIVRLFNFVIVTDNGLAVAVVAVFVVVAADIVAVDVVVFCVILKREKRTLSLCMTKPRNMI